MRVWFVLRFKDAVSQVAYLHNFHRGSSADLHKYTNGGDRTYTTGPRFLISLSVQDAIVTTRPDFFAIRVAALRHEFTARTSQHVLLASKQSFLEDLEG